MVIGTEKVIVTDIAYTVRRERYRRFFLLLFFGVIAAALGLAFGYPRVLTPQKDYQTFSGIARDGWIEDGAEIKLPRLFRRGNVLRLSLKSWRPAGQPPADLSFFLCGKLIKRHTVTSDKTIQLHLTGECKPRTVRIEVQNPFLPGGNDSRQLGAQLLRAGVGSRLGVPIIAPEVIFPIAMFLIVVMLLVVSVLPVEYGLLAAILTAGVGGWLIATTGISPIMRLFPLWGVLVTTLFGVMLAKGSSASEGQGSPSSSRVLETVLLGSILLFAGYLRYVHITFGLPMNFHPDEVPKVNAIMRMYSSGTLNPHYFLHPTLLLYSTYAMNTALHALHLVDGEFQSTLVYAGRMVSATAGVLSVYLTYKIGKLLFSSRAGLLAGALLAAFPLHVTCSRYLKEDALLTFFVLLSFLFAVLAYRTKKPFWLLLSGLFAGCSASVKYSGILSAGIPCLGALCLEERWIPRKRSTYLFLFVALLLVPLAFLACSPYVILDSSRFIKDFTVEQHHMSTGHSFAITPWAQYWTYHIERSLYPGMTAWPFLLGFLAIGYLAYKRQLSGLMVLALILAFYLPAEYVKAKPAPQPERYILPCLPFFALAISAFLDECIKRQLAFVLIGVLVLFSPVRRSLELHQEIVPDTRERMAEWMYAHLPKGTKVYVDHKRYSPELSEEYFQITYAPRSAIHRDLELKKLAREGQEYLLISSLWYDRYFSQPRTDEVVKRKIQKVLDAGKVVKRFSAHSGTYGFHNPVVTLFVLRYDKK